MERAFVINSNTAVTEFKDEQLRSLSSLTGRLDVIIRSLLAALTWREGVRRNVSFYAVLNGPPKPPLTVEVNGYAIKRLPLSEVDVAKLIYRCVKEEVEGVKVKRIGLKDVLISLKDRGYTLIYLKEEGRDVNGYRFEADGKYCFIVGDQIGLRRPEEEILEKVGVTKLSIGPLSYLSSHCIIYLNALLDRVEKVF